jgi:hypothetical protein
VNTVHAAVPHAISPEGEARAGAAGPFHRDQPGGNIPEAVNLPPDGIVRIQEGF